MFSISCLNSGGIGFSRLFKPMKLGMTARDHLSAEIGKIWVLLNVT